MNKSLVKAPKVKVRYGVLGFLSPHQNSRKFGGDQMGFLLPNTWEHTNLQLLFFSQGKQDTLELLQNLKSEDACDAGRHQNTCSLEQELSGSHGGNSLGIPPTLLAHLHYFIPQTVIVLGEKNRDATFAPISLLDFSVMFG